LDDLYIEEGLDEVDYDTTSEAELMETDEVLEEAA
jgi:hypothetical protein